jgi:molecular chaperone GrpE
MEVRVSTKEQKPSENQQQSSDEPTPDVAETTDEQAEAPEGGTQAAQAEAEEPGVEDLLGEVAALKEEVLRTHADMQNLRRRSERDVENAHKYALDKFVSELLPVADNLERATAAIDHDNEALKALGEGVELTLKSFMDVLKRFNVEQVDPRGEQFDPDRHQAMTIVPNPDVAPNTVIDVFQKGYVLNGRLVRPAMVVVSKSE